MIGKDMIKTSTYPDTLYPHCPRRRAPPCLRSLLCALLNCFINIGIIFYRRRIYICVMITFFPLLKLPFRDDCVQGLLPIFSLNPINEDLEDLVDG